MTEGAGAPNEPATGDAEARLRDAVTEDAPAAVAVLLACVALAGLGWELLAARYGGAAAGVWVAACAALASLGRRALAGPLVARERRALAALPFPVRGHLEALAEPPVRTATAVVVVELSRPMTPEEEARLEGSARAIGAEVAAVRGALVELRRHDVASAGRRGPTNGALRRAQRAVVERVLVPLHAVVPLVGASFRR